MKSFSLPESLTNALLVMFACEDTYQNICDAWDDDCEFVTEDMIGTAYERMDNQRRRVGAINRDRVYNAPSFKYGIPSIFI